jgi:hypothetical protein
MTSTFLCSPSFAPGDTPGNSKVRGPCDRSYTRCMTEPAQARLRALAVVLHVRQSAFGVVAKCPACQVSWKRKDLTEKMLPTESVVQAHPCSPLTMQHRRCHYAAGPMPCSLQNLAAASLPTTGTLNLTSNVTMYTGRLDPAVRFLNRAPLKGCWKSRVHSCCAALHQQTESKAKGSWTCGRKCNASPEHAPLWGMPAPHNPIKLLPV